MISQRGANVLLQELNIVVSYDKYHLGINLLFEKEEARSWKKEITHTDLWMPI